jgi:hypothetical protein
MASKGGREPPALRRAIEQARRLAEAVALDEQVGALHGEWARAWLAGRAGEIEQVVEQVRASFLEGKADERQASAALHGYLAELREGMERYLRAGEPGRGDGTMVDAGTETTEEHTVPRTVDSLLLGLSRRDEG